MMHVEIPAGRHLLCVARLSKLLPHIHRSGQNKTTLNDLTPQCCSPSSVMYTAASTKSSLKA